MKSNWSLWLTKEAFHFSIDHNIELTPTGSQKNIWLSRVCQLRELPPPSPKRSESTLRWKGAFAAAELLFVRKKRLQRFFHLQSSARVPFSLSLSLSQWNKRTHTLAQNGIVLFCSIPLHSSTLVRVTQNGGVACRGGCIVLIEKKRDEKNGKAGANSMKWWWMRQNQVQITMILVCKQTERFSSTQFKLQTNVEFV